MLRKGRRYEGPVVYVDGHHYPVGRDGHKKGNRPVVVEIDNDGNEFFLWGDKRSPKHQHVYEWNVVELMVEHRNQT